MATTIVPDPRPVDPEHTPQTILEAAHELLLRAQGDADKSEDESEADYYQGGVDFLKELEYSITID